MSYTHDDTVQRWRERVAERDQAELQPGTHPLGQHAWLVIEAGQRCWPGTHTPEQAANVLAAVLQCIDMLGGTAKASPPRAAAPAKPPSGNRTRTSKARVLPMNPGQGHHASAGSKPPSSDLDSTFWRHEVMRVDDHADRCEAIRRTADFLATLIHPEVTLDDETGLPVRGVFTEADQREQLLVEGLGWSLVDVGRVFKVTERFVALARIGDGRHPLTGVKWTVPQDNAIAAHHARAMRDAGLTSSDIGTALDRPAATVRAWTTQSRRNVA